VQGTDEAEDAQIAVEQAVIAQEHHHAYAKSQIEMMRAYAEVWDCRREFLLNYFGEEFPDLCGNCDNCAAGRTVAESDGDIPFPISSGVVHNAFGRGLLQRYEGDKAIVLFDDVGYKELLVDFVTETGALRAAQ